MLCDNVEGWDAVGGGWEVQEEGIYICIYDRFMLMCGRNQHDVVKQLALN